MLVLDTRSWWLVVAAALVQVAARSHPVDPLLHPLRPAATSGDTSYRLGRDVTPLQYRITIEPDYDALTFQGEVTIDVQATAAASTVTLHVARSLGVTASRFLRLEEGEPAAEFQHTFRRNLTNEFLVLLLDSDELVAGTRYRIVLTYNGVIGEDGRGFYRTSYRQDGEDKWLCVTQFQPTFARSAFPCFDEPGFRATFILTLVHPANMTALSTTRVSSVSRLYLRPGYVMSTFEETPAMPTYTLAWVVTEMPFRGELLGDFRSFSRPDALESLTVSQEEGPQYLQLMENFTGIPYPLDKLDQVAVPSVFYFSAMENWGLVTYREAYLLASGRTKSAALLNVHLTISHELTHQWFGNLVTPSWWSHTWISEGFAEYFQYRLLDQLEPTWGILDKIPAFEMHSAMAVDSSDSSTPLTLDVNSQDEILKHFGTITYSKGSSVLRMIDNLISTNTFQKGLQFYLKEMQYQAAEPEDLFDALQRAAVEDSKSPLEVDLKTFCKQWTEKSGYPIVNAILDREQGRLEISQGKYTPSEGWTQGSGWWVPLTVTLVPGEGNTVSVMLPPDEAVTMDFAKSGLLLLNDRQKGYYRVNYDLENWKGLSARLASQPGSLAESSRAMLVDDSLSLSRMGLLDYPVALHLLQYLPRERALAPWMAAATHIDKLAPYFRGVNSIQRDFFNNWVRSLVAAAFEEVGFSSAAEQSPLDGSLRAILARLACQAGHEGCKDAARRQYLRWKTGEQVAADTLAVSVCEGVTGPWARSDALSHALGHLSQSADTVERADIILGLGCLSGEHRTQLLQQLVDPTDKALGADDTRRVWRAVAASQTGVRIALETVSAQSQNIITKFGLDHFESVVADLAAQVTSEELLNLLSSVVSSSSPSEYLQSALDRAQSNVAWRAGSLAAVLDYIASSEPLAPRARTHLPDNVVPLSYAVRLDPRFDDLAAAGMSGAVDMLVRTVHDTDCVSWHRGRHLSATQRPLLVTEDGGTVLSDSAQLSYNEETEMETLQLLSGAVLADKTYRIHIEFTSEYDLLEAEEGLFVSVFPDGQRRLAATRLEPSSARQVFPCLDEPRFTATFRVSTSSASTHQLLSNMPINTTVNDPTGSGGLLTTFEDTPALPPHLVSLAVFDPLVMVYGEDYDDPASGVQVVLRVQPESEAAARPAASLIPLMLNKLTTTFGEIPLAKLDVLAVPQLPPGGDSTPGLWIARDGDLMVANSSGSQSNQELNAALLAANRVLHAWLGHHVTPQDWEGSWLLRGAADMLETWLVDGVNKKKFGAFERLGVIRLHRDLQLDVNDDQMPEDGSTRISMEHKGAGIWNMLLAYIGGPAFMTAMQIMAEMGPSKISPDEVALALQRGADDNGMQIPVGVDELLQSWAAHHGHPVVTLTRNYEDGTASISQERFTWDPRPAASSASSAPWIIPYNVVVRNATTPPDTPGSFPRRLNHVLTAASGTVTETSSADDYLLLNFKRSGFYRVNYDARNWRQVTAAVTTIPSAGQRAALLDDATALCVAGRLDVEVVLDLLAAMLPSEAEYAPWHVARRTLATLGHLARRTAQDQAILKRFVSDKLTRLPYAAVKWTPSLAESWSRGSLRSVVAELACHAGDKDCEKEAKDSAREWQGGSEWVYADVMAPTMCYKVTHSPSGEDFTEIIVRMMSTEDTSLRRAYIAGLGCLNDEEMRSILLKTTANAAVVERSDVLVMFESIMDNSDASLDEVLNTLVDGYSDMQAVLGVDLTNKVLAAAAERITEKAQLDKLQVLATRVAGGAGGAGELGAASALKRAEVNLLWAETARPKLLTWVYAQFGETPAPPTTTSTQPPTQPPTKPPTQPPTKPPTQPPTKPPTQSPTQPPTKPPTQPTTKSPTQPTTKPPTQSPPQPPTEHPTQSPTNPPTQPPTQPPTNATTARPRPTKVPDPNNGVASTVSPSTLGLLLAAILFLLPREH